MPTYQYICKTCGHELEELQSMSEPPLLICPNCNEATLARIMGGGSGLIFKGSGFYLTDYKSETKKPSSAGEKKEGKKEEKKTDTPTTTESSESKNKSPETKKPSDL